MTRKGLEMLIHDIEQKEQGIINGYKYTQHTEDVCDVLKATVKKLKKLKRSKN